MSPAARPWAAIPLGMPVTVNTNPGGGIRCHPFLLPRQSLAPTPGVGPQHRGRLVRRCQGLEGNLGDKDGLAGVRRGMQRPRWLGWGLQSVHGLPSTCSARSSPWQCQPACAFTAHTGTESSVPTPAPPPVPAPGKPGIPNLFAVECMTQI